MMLCLILYPPKIFLFWWVARESRNWAVKISMWLYYVFLVRQFVSINKRKETKTQVTFASEYPYFFHHIYDIFCSYTFFTLNYLCSSLIFANRPFHFKNFGTSKIFEEFSIFEDFFSPKILRICLWSIFRIQRTFIFIFSPFFESEESLYSSSVHFYSSLQHSQWLFYG